MRDIDNRSFGGDSVTFWGGGVKRHQGDVTKRLLANRTNHNQNRGPPTASCYLFSPASCPPSSHYFPCWSIIRPSHHPTPNPSPHCPSPLFLSLPQANYPHFFLVGQTIQPQNAAEIATGLSCKLEPSTTGHPSQPTPFIAAGAVAWSQSCKLSCFSIEALTVILTVPFYPGRARIALWRRESQKTWR